MQYLPGLHGAVVHGLRVVWIDPDCEKKSLSAILFDMTRVRFEPVPLTQYLSRRACSCLLRLRDTHGLVVPERRARATESVLWKSQDSSVLKVI